MGAFLLWVQNHYVIKYDEQMKTGNNDEGLRLKSTSNF